LRGELKPAEHPTGKFNCSCHRSTWRGQH